MEWNDAFGQRLCRNVGGDKLFNQLDEEETLGHLNQATGSMEGSW